MLNSPLLEVTIGMIFFYLLLSFICSALKELVESYLQNRASGLESGVRRLLDDPQGAGLANDLYNHPLVRVLYKDRSDLPSYIPARNFALALMDLAAPGGAKGAAPANPNSSPAPVMESFRQGVAATVKSEVVKRGLLALIDASGDDPAALRGNIENWYNSSMERVSGWYKRRTQRIITVLGIALAMVLNADSVAITQTLWHNAALRSSTLQAAQIYNEQRKSGAQTAIPNISSLNLPIGWNAQDNAHKLPARLMADPKMFLSWSLYQLDLHWLGWFITGLAISLGAPFWFDLLNKFIVVRSTVKPREKSQEEPSKD